MTNASFQVIPAIDIIDGGIVRLTQGDYNRVETYTTSPVDMAKRFEDAGAEKIHIVDLDGAKKGSLVNLDTIKAIRNSVSCKIELGGGIRDLDSVSRLVDLGIDYIVLGSLLTKSPELASEISHMFPQRIVAGIDEKDDNVAVEGWIEDSRITTQSLLDALSALPLAYVIYTDITKDGMMQGPNLSALEKVASFSPFPIVASGGVRDIRDIQAIQQIKTSNILGCIIGKAVLSGELSLDSLFN